MTARTAPSPRGDERRTALLASLDEHLQRSSLDSVTIADVSRAAGVTRSAFYFYFESKASAVAALMEEMYDEAFVAAGLLTGDATPAENIEATIRGLFAAFDRHEHVFRAMLEVRLTNAEVRALWESDRASFVPVVAAMIDDERRAGRAPRGIDATALATVLLELNDRMLERLALGGDLTRDQLVEAVVSIWLRSIYGTSGGPT